MLTEYEQVKIKELRDGFEAIVQAHGEGISDEHKAEYVGTSMATVDGLFAIREGETWRGITDPKDIARAVLRQMQIGE